MIKVVHVLSDMKIGGAGRWLLNLLEASDTKRYEIKVVLPVGSLLIDRVEALGFEVIAVEGMRDKSFDRHVVGLLLDIFRREKPQLVHTHASLSARLAAKMAGAKIINTKHCIDARQTGIKKLAGICINNLLSDGIIAVSEAVKGNITDNGTAPDKVSVIYGGIRPVIELEPHEKKRIRQKWGIGEEEVLVGMVARLAEVKGHKYFIDAAEIISRDNNKVRFLVAGTGPLEEELKKLVSRKGLGERFIFTGFIEDVHEIFNIIDINVISSLSEALCLSLIEGMYVGKPSVGTAVGGIPEVIKDGYSGYLVPAANSEKLADTVLKLVRDPELRKTMGDRGRTLAAERFTAEKMAEGVQSLYEKVIKKNERI